MRTKIYIISYVSFDGYDDNLYSDVRVFTDASEALRQFKQDMTTARADARGEDSSPDEEDWYDISEETGKDYYIVSRDSQTYYTKVKFLEKEIEI